MSQHTSPGSEDSGSTVLSPPAPETTGAQGGPPGSSPSNRSTYVAIAIGIGIVLVGTWLFDNVLKTNKSWDDFVDDNLSEWFQAVFEPDNAVGKIALLVVMTLVFMGVVGLLLLLVGHAPKRGQEKWQIAIFVVPGLFLLFYALFLPSIQTIVQSFQDKRGNFIGFENYQWMFTQPDIIVVIQNTFAWVLIVPISSVVIGLLYAIAVDGARTERLAKTLIFLPLAISFVGASIIWKFVYDYRTAEVPQIGLANQILVWLGQDTYQFIRKPALEHLLPHGDPHLDPSRLRHGHPVRRDQGHPHRDRSRQHDWTASTPDRCSSVRCPHPSGRRGGVLHHHRVAPTLRHRQNDDRRSVQDLRGGQRDVHPVVPVR